MNIKKGVITIAIGKKYADNAKYLALSAMLHAPHLHRAVITDCPKIVESYYDFVIPFDGDAMNPFALKTRVYRYTPFEQTLYLDADSLIMQNIDSCWDAFTERHFIYRGFLRTEGVWYFDRAEVIKALGIEWLPAFNSGMFLFDKSAQARAVFDIAFEYMTNHGELGVDFFRGKNLPDEPYFAIAFAKHNILPYEEECERFSRGISDVCYLNLNVIKGVSYIQSNSGKHAFPLIIHFFGRFGAHFYRREKRRLYFYFNPLFSKLLSFLLVSIRNLFKKLT
ncbi:MAG: hypothetical protein TREAZ_0686 [Treponematales bacterium]